MTKKKIFWWAVAIATVVVLARNEKVKKAVEKVKNKILDKII